MSTDRIARLANQIALFMASQPPERGAAGVASHINDFWEPRMRRKLFALIAAGGAELHPLVLAAAPAIRPPPADLSAAPE